MVEHPDRAGDGTMSDLHNPMNVDLHEVELDTDLYEVTLDVTTDVTADVERQLRPLGVGLHVEVSMNESIQTTPVRFRGSRCDLKQVAMRFGLDFETFDEACTVVVRVPRVPMGRDQ